MNDTKTNIKSEENTNKNLINGSLSKKKSRNKLFKAISKEELAKKSGLTQEQIDKYMK